MSIGDFIGIIVAAIVWNLLATVFGYDVVIVNMLVWIMWELRK